MISYFLDKVNRKMENDKYLTLAFLRPEYYNMEKISKSFNQL